MVLQPEVSVLKIKEGKFVTIQKIQRKLKLCAVDQQPEDGNEPLVHIWRHEENQKMALCFQRGKSYYFPKVDGNVNGEQSLTLEKASSNTPDKTSDRLWFERENLGDGDHYGLRSVVQPRQYLSINKKTQTVFILSQTREDCVLVTHRKIK